MSSPTLRAGRALLLIAFVAACAGPKVVRTPAPEVRAERGLVSWYGHPYHGRKTSSGETYDMEQMTAAHRTLPFGTWLLVENLATGKTVRVRVNDRGPFKEERILDVSRAAAVALGMMGPGVIRARVRVIPAPDKD
jgi:rare lipoprotein A